MFGKLAKKIMIQEIKSISMMWWFSYYSTWKLGILFAEELNSTVNERCPATSSGLNIRAPLRYKSFYLPWSWLVQLPAEVKVDFAELRLLVRSQLQAIAKDESAFKRMPLYAWSIIVFHLTHFLYVSCFIGAHI